jgi:transposase InsO family protein
VLDCYDRSILGWTFTRRCRTIDVIVALEAAVAVAFPYVEHLDIDEGATRVVLRHDNGTQFTASRYLETARTLGVKCSRTAYRHPDGNAFVERVYRPYKEECVWPNEFEKLRGGPGRDRGLGRRLQPGATAPVAPRPDPGRSPRRGPHPTQSCSLTVNHDRGHYAPEDLPPPPRTNRGGTRRWVLRCSHPPAGQRV